MDIHLDHLIVPSRDRRAAAALLAGLLGVPWSETGVGPFCPVYASDGRTPDRDQPDGHVWEILTESYARRPG